MCGAIAGGLLLSSTGCDKGSNTRIQQDEESLRARGVTVRGAHDWMAQPSRSVLVSSRQVKVRGAVVEQFRLALPADWRDPGAKTLGFDQSDLERFVVRLPSGDQDSVVEPGVKARTSTLSYRYPESGTTMSSMCVRSPAGAATKVHYCLKRIQNVGGVKAPISSSSSRFGDEAELRPLVPPERVVPGSDLPVMAYLGGERARGVAVYAFGPKGRVLKAITGNAGVADLRIDALGEWKIRVAGDVAGVQMVAELEFSNEIGGRL